MSGRRHRMRKVREVLRYRYECKLSFDRIASALDMSKGIVYKTIEILKRSGIQWPLPQDLTDTALEEILYKDNADAIPADEDCLDLEYIHKELTRPNVTIQLLWREYHDSNPQGISRATFFRKVSAAVQPEPNMKMFYKGGDLLFVDYSGDSLVYINKSTGLINDTELFVACWGASSYTYADVTDTQKSQDFCNSHSNAFTFFECVPKGLVPDNLKSGVTKPNRYEPQLNSLYAKLAQHWYPNGQGRIG